MCEGCGRKLNRPVAKCFQCRKSPLPLTYIHSAVQFVDPIPHIIHQFKYNGMFALAQPLAEVMDQNLPHWREEIDVLMPIPLHSQREKERGYNQANLLAGELSQFLNRPVDNQSLQRIRATKRQVGLSALARQRNVRDAFVAEPINIHSKHILLIDDVCTTGATLAAAAHVLQKAGATHVSAFCLARAQ